MAGDLSRRAKRDAQRRQRAVGQFERDGGAVFDLDRVDACGGAGKNAPDRA
jgi:hypothetical protein